mmetsp:Transcript_7028/g.23071  ORF Transcript_7028/g.23071 Transcript_7028/m.23071 type:complete len:214 (-) Transcript_7028:294-935(-)
MGCSACRRPGDSLRGRSGRHSGGRGGACSRAGGPRGRGGGGTPRHSWRTKAAVGRVVGRSGCDGRTGGRRADAPSHRGEEARSVGSFPQGPGADGAGRCQTSLRRPARGGGLGRPAQSHLTVGGGGGTHRLGPPVRGPRGAASGGAPRRLRQVPRRPSRAPQGRSGARRRARAPRPRPSQLGLARPSPRRDAGARGDGGSAGGEGGGHRAAAE